MDENNNPEQKVIRMGTVDCFAKPSDLSNHCRILRARYANCTRVDGNLELTWLHDANVDLTFLHSIREVTGYILIYKVDAQKISFPNLQTVHGKSLLHDEFALCVKDCPNLEVLSLPKLAVISSGSVAFVNCHKLCDIHMCGDTSWDYILQQSEEANVLEWCECLNTKNVII